MEEHVGEKRVAGDDAGRFTAVHGMDGSGVFDGIELALSFDGVFDAGVFFHGNGFDPGHEESSLSWDGSWREGSDSAAPLQQISHDLGEPSTQSLPLGDAVC